MRKMSPSAVRLTAPLTLLAWVLVLAVAPDVWATYRGRDGVIVYSVPRHTSCPDSVSETQCSIQFLRVLRSGSRGVRLRQGWDPSFAPDGRSLTYVTGFDFDFTTLWMSFYPRGRADRLTPADQLEYLENPHFSPNGKTIVVTFEDREAQSGDSHLYRIPVRGGARRRLFSFAAWWPVWSIDNRLAFIRAGYRLYVTNPGLGHPHRLTRLWAGAPDFSPDGRWIAFEHCRGLRCDIDMITSDGKELRRVARDGVHPVFSPDGREIAYLSADCRRLMAVSVASRITRVLSSDPAIDCTTTLAWQPLR